MNEARHLELCRVTLPRAAEWAPGLPGWSFVRVDNGMGYFWRASHPAQALSQGDVALLGCSAKATFRASQLNDLELRFFYVQPEKLGGVLTLNEQRYFGGLATKSAREVRVLPGIDPIAQQFAAICEGACSETLTCRVRLLQIFTESFPTGNIADAANASEELGARERLLKWSDQICVDELPNLSLGKLAETLRCSPRHANRLFNEVFGCSFRSKQTELRLRKASQLLDETHDKVVTIAGECGYQSLGLFNLMFKKRFGTTPSHWRKQRSENEKSKSRPAGKFALSN